MNKWVDFNVVHKKSIFISGFRKSNVWHSAINLFILRENSMMRTHKFYWKKPLSFNDKEPPICTLVTIGLIGSILKIYICSQTNPYIHLFICSYICCFPGMVWKIIKVIQTSFQLFCYIFNFRQQSASNWKCEINFPIVWKRIQIANRSTSM